MSTQIRMADALLRSVGGRTVLLRIPSPAMNGDLGEQLGLAVPEFQDVELGPVAFRRVRATTGTADAPDEVRYELLVSASAVTRLVGSLGFEAADVLFAQAAGVLVDGSLLGIAWVASAEAFGTVYLYRLGLRGAVKAFL
jgi:hypothetical protein